jgi:hypothetical protein
MTNEKKILESNLGTIHRHTLELKINEKFNENGTFIQLGISSDSIVQMFGYSEPKTSQLCQEVSKLRTSC